jgi:hypothetical protein
VASFALARLYFMRFQGMGSGQRDRLDEARAH